MKARLKRKSFFVDEEVLRQARVELGVSTDAEAVRAALLEVSRMKALARFMKRTAGSLPPGSFSAP
jgi:Arc/MetJ family transcription regulator